MSLQPENGDFAEKHEKNEAGNFSSDPENMVAASENVLHQDLKGRHMQMIAMQVSTHEPSSDTNECV
jgi:amino acid transporter